MIVLGWVGLVLGGFSAAVCLVSALAIVAVEVAERLEERRARRADEQFLGEIGATLR